VFLSVQASNISLRPADLLANHVFIDTTNDVAAVLAAVSPKRTFVVEENGKASHCRYTTRCDPTDAIDFPGRSKRVPT